MLFKNIRYVVYKQRMKNDIKRVWKIVFLKFKKLKIENSTIGRKNCKKGIDNSGIKRELYNVISN